VRQRRFNMRMYVIKLMGPDRVASTQNSCPSETRIERTKGIRPRMSPLEMSALT